MTEDNSFSINSGVYDLESHIAELYDSVETDTVDVDLIRRLIRGLGPLRILEPFCGTGRMLIPLAEDGHKLTGLDQSHGMIARLRGKVAELPAEVQARIQVSQADALAGSWPAGFDLVILGNNCFYELATPEEQSACIQLAAAALKPGGFVYVDNDHMEGELAAKWREPGIFVGMFPRGLCQDGTRLESTMETVWFDAGRRLVRLRRVTSVAYPDGSTREIEYIQQKHPVSQAEVLGWLGANNFKIMRQLGDYEENNYTPASPRAIFWAQKGP